MQNTWISPNRFRRRRRRGSPPAKIRKGGGAARIKTAKEPVKNIGSNHILILGEENFLILMIYESKSGYIFDICEVCQKELNEAEKTFCDAKTEETGIFHKLCNICLNAKYNGKYPAV